MITMMYALNAFVLQWERFNNRLCNQGAAITALQARQDRLRRLINEHRIFFSETNELRGFAETRQTMLEELNAEIAQELTVAIIGYNRLADISRYYPDRLITPLSAVPWDRKVLNMCEMRKKLENDVDAIEDRYEKMEHLLDEHHTIYQGGGNRHPEITVVGRGNDATPPISP